MNCEGVWISSERYDLVTKNPRQPFFLPYDCQLVVSCYCRLQYPSEESKWLAFSVTDCPCANDVFNRLNTSIPELGYQIRVKIAGVCLLQTLEIRIRPFLVLSLLLEDIPLVRWRSWTLTPLTDVLGQSFTLSLSFARLWERYEKS